MTSEMERLDKYRSQVRTRSGPASYVDTGGPGRPVLFVHGVGTSSYLWRNVIGQLDGERRCVAVDLPLHGYTPAAPDQDFTLPGLARFVADCCDALELTDFDMVANDTGGAVTQVFAANHPERLHTLTLTNCEAHNNVPPKALLPAVLLARMGLLARLAPRLMPHDNPRTAKRMYGRTYQDIANLPEEIARVWLEAEQWSVDEATSERAALARIAAARPDVILLDLMMPEMDGFAVVAALQKKADWRDIPVIVITSLDLDAKDRERLNAGVQFVLVKERFRPADLVERIRRLVQRTPAVSNGMEAAS